MSPTRFSLVALCFAVSGFSALLYETVWMRGFSLHFGSSALATTTVLAAYMLGLAGGAGLGGRVLAGRPYPLRLYAALEVLAALTAAMVLPGLQVWDWLVGLGQSPAEQLPPAGGLAQNLGYFLAGGALIALPTLAMGATLPVLSRAVVASEAEIAGRVGLLYGCNTLGAVVGTLSGAYLWIPEWGLQRTIYLGVVANLVAGLAGLALNAGRAPVTPAQPCRTQRRLLALVTLGGVAALAYEVLWTRILTLVVGSSLAAFALMLACFLAGLALGSGAAAGWARSPRQAVLGFGACQLATGWAFTYAYTRLGQSTFLAIWTGRGELDRMWENLSLAAVLLVPGCLFLGASFTFAVRAFTEHPDQVGSASALVFRWNTLGGIVGTIVASIILIPDFGFAGASLMLLALTTQLGIGATALSGSRFSLGLAAGLGGTLALVLGLRLVLVDPHEVLRQSPHDGREGGEVVYAASGRNGSVLVTRNWGWLFLRLDGLRQSGTRVLGAPRTPTAQRWLSGIPLMLRPQAGSMLVIGLGLGELLEGLPEHLQIDVVELEPLVAAATAHLARLRAVQPAPFRLICNDARSALQRSARRYDIIISQPSHPWTLGANNLFTQEFAALARAHLTDSGVYVQWVGTSGLDPEGLRSLAATLRSQFPEVALYRPVPGMFCFVCSASVLEPPRWTTFPLPELFACPEDIAATHFLDTRGVARLAEGARVLTDDHNRLLTRAGGGTLAWLDEQADPDYPEDLDFGYLGLRLVHQGFTSEGLKLARERGGALGLARAQWEAADQQAAVETLAGLETPAARFMRLRAHLWPSQVPGSAAGAFPPPYAAVVKAGRAAAGGDWESVRPLEITLAQIPVTHPAYELATQLRAAWRIELGVPGAIDLLDRLLGHYRSPYSLALRAEAAFREGQTQAQLETLRELLDLLWWGNRRPLCPGRLSALLQINLDGLYRSKLEDREIQDVYTRLDYLLKSRRVRE